MIQDGDAGAIGDRIDIHIGPLPARIGRRERRDLRTRPDRSMAKKIRIERATGQSPADADDKDHRRRRRHAGKSNGAKHPPRHRDTECMVIGRGHKGGASVVSGQ